jgi:hypothetical protein
LTLFSLFILYKTRDDDAILPMIHLWRRESGALKLERNRWQAVRQRSFGGERMVSLNMHSLVHWFATNGSFLAVIVTVGVALLLVCCVGCTNCPCRSKDDLFRRHEL